MKAPARKAVPMKDQRDIALRQLAEAMRKLGLEQVEEGFELDHDPALGIRPINEDGTDYVPPQHDPKYLIWRPKAAHLVKTTGRHGTSDLSVDFNGDTSRAAKVKRIAPEQEEFRQRVLAREPGQPRQRKGTIKGNSTLGLPKSGPGRASAPLSKITLCFRD